MQHLAYQPLLPTMNKYLQLKWDKASYEIHLRKVKSAKPTIDTTAPKSYGHLALTRKKLEEQSMSNIQRENNMLLEKISQIRRTNGCIHNRNDYEKKSLCRERQQQERLRITKENELALLRLNQCQPHNSINGWHEDWHKKLKLMENISRYPRKVTDKKGRGQACIKSSNNETKQEDSLGAEHGLNSTLIPNGRGASAEGTEESVQNKEGQGPASTRSSNTETKEEDGIDAEHGLNNSLVPNVKGESEEETEESDQKQAQTSMQETPETTQ